MLKLLATGGRGYMAIQPEFASVINRIYAQFLARLPRHDLGLRTSVVPLNARLQQALDDLADLTGDYALADARDQAVLNSNPCPPADSVHQLVIEWCKHVVRHSVHHGNHVELSIGRHLVPHKDVGGAVAGYK